MALIILLLLGGICIILCLLELDRRTVSRFIDVGGWRKLAKNAPPYDVEIVEGWRPNDTKGYFARRQDNGEWLAWTYDYYYWTSDQSKASQFDSKMRLRILIIDELIDVLKSQKNPTEAIEYIKRRKDADTLLKEELAIVHKIRAAEKRSSLGVAYQHTQELLKLIEEQNDNR